MLSKVFRYAMVLQWICFNNVYSEPHKPQAFLQHIAGSKQEGEAIVGAFCANCHAVDPLIPLGAPRIGVKADWEPRLRQGKRILLKHTDEGLNAMPSRGGCFECSDEQLWLAIAAMLPQKQAHSASAKKNIKKAKRKNNL